MKINILAVILFAITALAASAKVNVEDSFSYENDTFTGLNLNYRIAKKGDSANIVVIFLHGGNGQGDDNKTQMKSPAIADIYNYLNNNRSGGYPLRSCMQLYSKGYPFKSGSLCIT